MGATMTLTDDLKKMSGEAANVKMTHTESVSRMVREGSDHQSLRTALESRIEPMNPVTYVAGSLLNISSGQLTQPNVNVDKALDIGTRQPGPI